MTSLDDDLETLGKLMANNLTNRGVTSTYSEGLTTLANKITSISTGETYTISTITPFTTTGFIDEQIPITITAVDSKNKPAAVKIYLKIDNIVQEKTVQTLKNGRAVLNFSSNVVGEHTIQAFINETSVSSPITITLSNPNYYVNPAGDDSNAGTSSTAPFKTLNKAISTATDKSSIYVQAGYYVGTSNTVLTISKNLTIYGDGSAVFSGENSRQSGFTVNTGYAVTCNGLKFINGGGNAGAVTVNDNCSIINCTFQNNLKSTSTNDENSWGGAVYCIGSKNLIFNSNFYSNKAYSGGGIYNNSSNNTVTDCTFTGNNASNYGGGIWNSSSNTVTDCTFTGNNASNYGGGIYNNSSNNTVTDCTFSNNASNYGGGIYNNSSNTVTDCTFSNNASNYGGGIYNNSSNTVTDCTFSNNASNYGGGIYNSSSNNTVTDCTFSNNTSSNGGGIYNSSSNNTVTDCTFTGNNASNYGGGIWNNSSNTVTDCTFTGNNASSNGGGIYNSSSNNTVTDCTFSNNTSSNGGGIYNSSSNNTVTDCTFSNNASNYGGGIYINGNNDNVKNCTFKNNTPTNLYVQGTYSGTITNCYWGTDTPTSANWGTTIGNYTVINNATSKTVYNIIKYTKASVSSGTNIPLTFKCLDCNGNPLSNMEIVLKNGTTTLATLTTDNYGIATYTVTVTANMSLTITNTATNNYNSCTSETRTITVA